MSFHSFFNRLQSQRKVRQAIRGHAGRQPRFEALEDRCLLSLTAATSYPAGTAPQAIVAADFNNDGRLDLAVANSSSNSVSVLLGNGNGTFQQAQTSAAGDNPVSLAVGDFNSDGTLDLAAADGGGRGVNVMFGNRDGTFRAPMHIPAGWTENGQRGPGSLATGDFNGDGRMDLVVTSNYGHDYYSYPQGRADVLLAVGDGSFRAPRTYWAYNRALGAAVVTDFNGDGFQDLVTEMPDYSAVIVLLGDGQGNVGNYEWAGPVAAISSNPSAAADLNGDGDIDLVSAPGAHEGYGSVGVMLGDGYDGCLSQYPNYYGVGGTPDAAILGDFDRDGRLDIAAAVSANNNVSVVRGLGDGTFEPAENFAVGSGGTAATNGDINADGRVDAADYVVWRKNGGTPNQYNDWRANFGRSAGAVQDPRPVDLAMGDFNGDGWLDIATANRNGNSVSVLFNDQSWPVLPPGITLSGATATEGHSGTVNAAFTLTLSKPATLDATVHVSTADITAIAGSDYVAASGIVTIPAGQTSKTFTVAIIGDRVAEENEYFYVNLSSPTNAIIVGGQAYGIILDDEPRISMGGVTVTEGNTGTINAMFTVNLSATSPVDVTVDYSTADGSAVAGSDYTSKSGDVTIPAGQTSATFAVPVLGDRDFEPTEYFSVTLSNATNAVIANAQAFGAIVDDEPRISINDVIRVEGRQNKTTLFTFTVTLSAAYDQAVTMSYRTVDGTATTSDNDYVAKTGTLTFAPGETMKTITIEVKGDSKNELNETFYVDLFDGSSNSLFTKFRGIGTIWNDD